LVEVELKYKIKPIEMQRLVKKLIQLGCKVERKSREVDVYYQHPVRDFRETDEALRLRVTGNKVELTYKGPRMSNRAKVREEVSVGVESFSKMDKVLRLLGFNPVAKVIKERVYYECPNNICISLDDVQELGQFIELEYKGELDVDNAIEILLSFAKELGIKDKPIIKSYLELLLELQGS